MKSVPILLIVVGVVLNLQLVFAQPVPKLPVREVTVFKDGHAFFVHEGEIPSDREGRVQVQPPAAPVLGTFWTYSPNGKSKIRAVTATRQPVAITHTALHLRELLEANLGKEVILIETNGNRIETTLLETPVRSRQELESNHPQRPPVLEPERSPFLAIKTVEGMRFIAFERIAEVIFRTPPTPGLVREQMRDVLEVQLAGNASGGGSGAGGKASLGMVYLQKGIRWIPSYRVDLDGKGRARVALQATLINEAMDLEDVTVQLVIGVPTFKFKDQLDPMAIQGALDSLSAFFQSSPAAAGRSAGGLMNAAFSNRIMSQAMVAQAPMEDAAPVGEGSTPALDAASREDLHVLTLKNIRLKKGQRAVHVLDEITVDYEDLYTLEIPYTPPSEVVNSGGRPRGDELSKQLNAPKVQHKARLKNSGGIPFTTAPVLLMSGGKVISQGTMTYTPPKGSCDIVIGTAVNLTVRKSDAETSRTPNSIYVARIPHIRVDLKGSVSVVNRTGKPVEVEVIRHVLGFADSADQGGKIELSNVLESRDHVADSDGGNVWNYYPWPWWWHESNGVGKITWKLKLDPDASPTVNYTWHYFWR